MDINILIGIEDLCFSLPDRCIKKYNMPLVICLSLLLEGDFLHSALSDHIGFTVDYEALSNHIKKSLSILDCASLQGLSIQLPSIIRSFSPLITDGYFLLQIKCHETFTIRGVLAMPFA